MRLFSRKLGRVHSRHLNIICDFLFGWQESSHGGGTCEIKYKLEARLHRPGILNFDATGKTDLKVFCDPEEAPPTPVTMGPDTHKVTSCCCFSGGRCRRLLLQITLQLVLKWTIFMDLIKCLDCLCYGAPCFMFLLRVGARKRYTA